MRKVPQESVFVGIVVWQALEKAKAHNIEAQLRTVFLKKIMKDTILKKVCTYAKFHKLQLALHNIRLLSAISARCAT
jgi:hypothetical protein